MRFYVPSNIYVEKNCVKNHKEEFPKIGKKALIVTGRHSAKVNGSLDDVLSVLEEKEIPYVIFDQVEENPSLETVEKGALLGKDSGADFLIGIGGGSPIDAAKAMAILMANPEEPAADLYVNKGLSHLPVVAIPTTCGTGTEATAVSVLTNHQKGMKKSIPYKIFPSLSLVDGKYLAAARKSLIISTSIDALAHAVESYLNSKSDIYNRMFPEYAFRLWAQNKEALASDAALTEDQCELFMLTSTIAGMAIAHTGTGIPHGMSYDLTYHKNVPHGMACGYFLAAYMEVCAKYVPDQVKNVLTMLDFADLEEFRTYLTSLIGSFEISREEKESFAQAMAYNEGKLSAAPCKVTPEDIHFIYEKSLIIK